MVESKAVAIVRLVLDDLVNDGAVGALAELVTPLGAWQIASGSAIAGQARAVDPAGHFRIGSVSKTVTATMVHQLVDEGRLGLDDPVGAWLPGLVPFGDSMTIRHLLAHMAGLYNYTNALTVEGVVRDRLTSWSPSQVVALASKHEPQFAPGTARAYNNTGYVVLGMVIEKAAAATYSAELSRRIIEPLSLRHTRSYDEGPSLPRPHARGFLQVDGALIDITTYDPSHAGAAGGLISTAADLNLFFRALLGGDLLRPEQQKEMLALTSTAETGLRAGLGITSFDLPNGLTVYGKDGGIFGYRTWSFHTAQAQRQLTISATTGSNKRLPTPTLLTKVAAAFESP